MTDAPTRLTRTADGSLARYDWRGLTVLVVEPEETARGSLETALNEIGIASTLLAHSADRAYELCGDIDPQILICDSMLTYPDGPDGLQMLQDIREDSTPLPKDIPVLMVAGDAGSFSVMEAKRLGIDGFLVKPMPLKRLEGALRRILERSFPERVRRAP